MNYYLAPLEGITTRLYRNLYHKYFEPFDKYFAPFLVPHTKRGFSNKEKAEIDPAMNPGIPLVPQILTNDAAGFLSTVKKLEQYGYKEVNLNLGCPSKTVTGKGRGAGFLKYPEKLDRFLDDIFTGTDVSISIKTRIGITNEEEFSSLLDIYNRYPLHELIIHPRTLEDYYKNTIHTDAYKEAMEKSTCKVCYNGDIRNPADDSRIAKLFPDTHAVMIGRGVIANPNLLALIKGKTIGTDKTKEFVCELADEYVRLIGNEKQALYKIKEICSYMSWCYPDEKKLFKKMMKTQSISKFDHYLLTLVS